MNNSQVIDRILEVVKKLTKNTREYIRIIEYKTFFFVSYNDYSEPFIFDKDGVYTGKIFSQYSREEKKNPKEVYYEK